MLVNRCLIGFSQFKAKVLAERNKAILRDFDNQIDLNFGLMKLCVGEFECQIDRINK